MKTDHEAPDEWNTPLFEPSDNGKFTAAVTQFFRPNGGNEETSTELALSLKSQFELMRSLGCRLTVEVLNNGRVSVCIEHPAAGDYDCRIPQNGPDVKTALEAMLRDFNLTHFEAWKAEAMA